MAFQMTFNPSHRDPEERWLCGVVRPTTRAGSRQFTGRVTDLDDVNGQRDFPVCGRLISLLADTPAEPA